MEVFYTDSFIPHYGIGEEFPEGRFACEDYLFSRFLLFFIACIFRFLLIRHVYTYIEEFKVMLNVRHLQRENSVKDGLKTVYEFYLEFWVYRGDFERILF
jgi:hypothetical protein